VERSLFAEEHDLFREEFRKFIERDVRPNQEKWFEDGIVSRDVWRSAGEAGFLCTWLEEEWGGPGGDFLHSTIVMEELSRAYENGFAMTLHSDVVTPYIYHFGSEEQKRVWLPRCASGESITAIAMSEPDAGSDLAAMRTRAEREGDEYVLNGSKIFISNGILCDVCIVAARTDPDDRHGGISLFLVEADRPGFHKGRKLKKMGMFSQDTAELSFDDCRIPAENLLGEEGAGFRYLMTNLQQERLTVSIGAQATADQVLEDTIAYVTERKAFGKRISDFQNTQFKLAECAAKLEAGRAFLDRLIESHMAGKDVVKECSMSKLWHTEMAWQVVDECLQFFGGYGYMLEYPVSRAFLDMRVQRVYAGSNEIMKLIIARQLGL
jgi:acyl-CoA dehydrogenase